jgi:hypothetical protein
MHIDARLVTIIVALTAVIVAPPEASAEETWVRVKSHDERVSVLFPRKPDKIETTSRKSPAGKVDTRRVQYEEEGVLLSIAGTKLPRAALKFAGSDKILHNAAEGVFAKYYAKKTSEKKTKISGEPAVILEFRVPDYEDENHPGYRGISIALLVDETLYVITGILTKEDPKSKAKQQKLLGSIQVHK